MRAEPREKIALKKSLQRQQVAQNDIIEAETKDEETAPSVEAKKIILSEKPRKKIEPTEAKTIIAEPISEPVKPKPQPRNDLTGRWRADDNKAWIIQQSGNNVTISFCDESGQSCDMTKGRLEGNYLSYHSTRRGKDKKGSFTVSSDFKTLNGKINVAFGLSNRITVVKID